MFKLLYTIYLIYFELYIKITLYTRLILNFILNLFFIILKLLYIILKLLLSLSYKVLL